MFTEGRQGGREGGSACVCVHACDVDALSTIGGRAVWPRPGVARHVAEPAFAA